MLRPWVILVTTLSIVTSIQARPTSNNALFANTSPSTIPSEPATLMGRHYQVTNKREPLILMDPALEQIANAQKHQHHAHTQAFSDSHPSSRLSMSSASNVDHEKKKETKASRRNVGPFPRYLAGRSWNVLSPREPHDVYTSDHVPSKQPAGAQYSEAPEAAPSPPGYDSHFIDNGKNGGTGHAAGGVPSTSTNHVSNQGLGLAGLGLGGSSGGGGGGGSLGLAGLGGSSGGGSGGSGLDVLGGLIGG